MTPTAALIILIPMPKPITVLLVDDYAVVRHGLRALIETTTNIMVVGEAGDGDTAVSQTRILRPDVAIMDMVMPGLNALQAIRAMRQISPPYPDPRPH